LILAGAATCSRPSPSMQICPAEPPQVASGAFMEHIMHYLRHFTSFLRIMGAKRPRNKRVTMYGRRNDRTEFMAGDGRPLLQNPTHTVRIR